MALLHWLGATQAPRGSIDWHEEDELGLWLNQLFPIGTSLGTYRVP